MTQRQGDYSRDPLDILLEKERGTCAGCKYEIVISFGADKRKVCNSMTKKHGRRCSAYVEGKA